MLEVFFTLINIFLKFCLNSRTFSFVLDGGNKYLCVCERGAGVRRLVQDGLGKTFDSPD